MVKEASFIIRKQQPTPYSLSRFQLTQNRQKDNQWQVDFNLSLESFEPHIAGVRELIELSNSSPKKPPILFTSSISTLNNWPLKHPDEKVPERAFHDFSIPAAMGYGESKYISERLLEIATEKCGISAAIVRVGQLAGPVVKEGVWSKQEWLPSVSSPFHPHHVTNQY